MNKLEIDEYFSIFNSNALKLSTDLNMSYNKLRRRLKKDDLQIFVELDEEWKPLKLMLEHLEEIVRN